MQLCCDYIVCSDFVTTLYVQTYYPGNPNRGAALLASYVWEHEADYWLGMTDEECKMKVGTQ